MNFELGKEYIVKVSKEGIIPIEEFKSDRFFDRDCDDLDFLTDEEKIIVINAVLDKISTEIEQVAEEESKFDIMWAKGLKYALEIIDKYKVESEE